MKKLFLFFLLVSITSASSFSYRKYSHVKAFYQDLTPSALKIAKKYHLPPAAVLAIAGLESGYGSGYVSQITGNIMSLGAYKSDIALPALYLPYSTKKKMILYDEKEIKKHPKEDLHYKLRAKSLKRDYRPLPYTGTHKNLNYFKYHPQEKALAHYQCLQDFATRWIRVDAKIKTFAKAKRWLNEQVKAKGEEVLYLEKTNIAFIHAIGGIPHSFNYRTTWPKKVISIMNKTGLVKLCQEVALEHKSFEEAWRE